MENMFIYNSSKDCPQNALKPIQAGKLKGKSDINPLWRIKKLTELFGPCGQGWKTQSINYWTTPGAEGEVIAWCSLELVWREPGGEWSDPVPGIGGSMLVDTQKGRLVSNDEAYKMAHTDAISVACKSLGFAADVYWQQDRTKYDRPPAPSQPRQPAEPAIKCECCGKYIPSHMNRGVVYTPQQIAENAKKAYGACLCWDCMIAAKSANAPAAEHQEG